MGSSPRAKPNGWRSRFGFNPEWRLAIEELAATRKLLRSAPRYRAPRNFTLSAETARSLARKPLFPPFPAFRFSAALAALSLLAVGALQVIGLNRRHMVAMAPQAAPAMEAAPLNMAEATPAADTQKSFAAEPNLFLPLVATRSMGVWRRRRHGGGAMDTPPLASEALKGNSCQPGGGIVTYGDQPAPEFAGGLRRRRRGDRRASPSRCRRMLSTGEATRDQSAPADRACP